MSCNDSSYRSAEQKLAGDINSKKNTNEALKQILQLLKAREAQLTADIKSIGEQDTALTKQRESEGAPDPEVSFRRWQGCSRRCVVLCGCESHPWCCCRVGDTTYPVL